MAEGVVRFRKGYKRADLERIEVQQKFMKEFFSQVINKKNLKNNIFGLLTTFLQDVQTNFNVTNIVKYSRYVNKINSDSISFNILPGNTRTINGVSYFLCNKKKTQQLVDEIFYSSSQKKSHKDIKIKILNNSGNDKIAIEKKILLEKDHYKIDQIENYAGENKYQTRIIIRQNNSRVILDDLKNFFKDALIEIDKEMPQDFDVIIILGSCEN
jgi:anionic cell wall polymer biosynthesis LytR-Cps2A-Psr (LCP) family protein